jgi:dihydroorotate dehydrogenase (NAD+) catalytic subunit
MQPKISVKIGKLKLKNPVMVASGTFGYAQEFRDFMGLDRLGAIVTKTITVKPRKGNRPPRTCETPAGMLNSIGLENPGLEEFIDDKLPALGKIGAPIIVSIASESEIEEFGVLAARLDKIKAVSAIELNISCPNIRHGAAIARSGGLISQDPRSTYDVVKAARKVTGKTLITKLSPNVTDITVIARAAEEAGSDALSLINTVTGMSIDTRTRQPKVAAVTAGLSGPAVRPIAVRMVWEVFRKVRLPIIGMGGIIDTPSALEFFLAGASAVSVGTVNFINPAAGVQIIAGLKEYLSASRIGDIRLLTGALKA